MEENLTLREFTELPRRIFLDSCTLQWLGDYSEYIWEGIEVPNDDSLYAVTEGYANLSSLRDIFFVNQRAAFVWVVSQTVLDEAKARGDSRHLQWSYDVLHHTLDLLQLSGGPTAESQALAARLDGRLFNYLSRKDCLLIRDAVLLRCDSFLTVEQRLPRNARHIQRELGLRILKPVEYWDLLKPWAHLYV